MRILITGGAGQLGSDCTRVLAGGHEVLSVNSRDLDITQPSSVEGVVSRFRPQVILNCAAYTQVDAAETERERAWAVNVEGPRHLAMAAKTWEAVLVHISTDYVFEGRRTPPESYREKDETHPLSYYGITKWEGEKAIRGITPHHMILRTAWLYGKRGHNFLKTMLRLTVRDPSRPIRVVHDQFGCPTWSYRLALQIGHLILMKGQGTYHATGTGYCTWYELAVFFLKAMGVRHEVVPCTTAEYPTPTQRPRNSILDNHRLREAGWDLMPPWEADVKGFAARFRQVLWDEAQVLAFNASAQARR